MEALGGFRREKADRIVKQHVVWHTSSEICSQHFTDPLCNLQQILRTVKKYLWHVCE